MEAAIPVFPILLNGVFAMSQIALVADECGAIQGPATPADLLEAISGAKASIGKLTFEIIDMDGRRIDALLAAIDDEDAAA